MAAARSILALCYQPVLRPKATSILAVSKEGLVVQLQVAQSLPLFLGLQCAELEVAQVTENGARPDGAFKTPSPIFPRTRGQCAVLP